MWDHPAAPNGGPPPPVVREDGYNYYQRELLAVTIVCLILPTLVVALRLLTRVLIKVQVGWDDCCIFIALVRPLSMLTFWFNVVDVSAAPYLWCKYHRLAWCASQKLFETLTEMAL